MILEEDIEEVVGDIVIEWYLHYSFHRKERKEYWKWILMWHASDNFIRRPIILDQRIWKCCKMLVHIQKLSKAKIKHNIAFHATVKTKITIYISFIGKFFPPLIFSPPPPPRKMMKSPPLMWISSSTLAFEYSGFPLSQQCHNNEGNFRGVVGGWAGGHVPLKLPSLSRKF